MTTIYEDFTKLQEEFHETIENYPLFEEDITRIFDKDIKDIEDLLDKNDEYYIKKAYSKLEDVIKYIKDTSTDIKTLYRKYDTLVEKWEHINLTKDCPKEKIEYANKLMMESNKLIKEKNINSIKLAVDKLEDAIKEFRGYLK